jgi:hypothetical protein
MKKLTILVAVLLIVGFSGLASAEDASWTGFISDEACAKDYEKASADAHVACAKGCVSKGGNWALAMKEGHVVLKIDKEMAESHLGKMVVVKGTLDEATNTVKVSSVEASH